MTAIEPGNKNGVHGVVSSDGQQCHIRPQQVKKHWLLLDT